MCGIAGIFHHDGREADPELLRRMSDAIIHRGPDGEGVQTLSGGGFSHRRLSIIDLDHGAQPMPNEDETVWICYNGEVYNFPELKPALESKGHAFRTHCDTEVIVHLFEDEGTETPKHLRGMFAFGIWDTRERFLFLSRDRAGKKPLFWFEDDDGIYFASEMKALLELSNCPRGVDPEAIELYLTYQSIPGTRTIFKGVNRVAPAHSLTWRPGAKATTQQYWSADWETKTDLDYASAKTHLRELIVDATKARLISDVPLGAFLSGGVDSSAVVAAMAEVATGGVKTFSIGFPEEDFTETRFARIVAEKFGTEHQEFVVEPEAIDILPKLVRHYDQPYADSSALPTYYLSKMTREHVKVALNGDGGDEQFGGYDRYRALLYHSLYQRFSTQGLRSVFSRLVGSWPEGSANRSVVRKMRRFAQAAMKSPEEFSLSLFAFFDREMRTGLYSERFLETLDGFNGDGYMLDLLNEKQDSLSILDRVLRADTLGYLPNTLLVKVDIATMATSLEARSPLLDTKIMEFAASMPAEWKYGLRYSKKILKEAHEGILPHNILYRPKMGFGVPLSHWFRGELYDYIREVLLDPKSIERGYFNSENIEFLIEQHRSGARNNANRLWALLMLELWHREFLP